jgi:hypothetical protein
MTIPTPESAGDHEYGECPGDCEHPDHFYDRPFEVPADVYDDIVWDALRAAEDPDITFWWDEY